MGFLITSGTLSGGNELFTFANGYTCTRTSSNTQGMNMLWFSLGNNNITCKNIGLATKITPYTYHGRAVVEFAAPVNNATVSNIGSEATPFDFADRVMFRLVYIAGGSKNVTVRRCYATGGTMTPGYYWITALKGADNILVENVYVTNTYATVLQSDNTITRGSRIAGALLDGGSTGYVYPGLANSSSWQEGFSTDTVGAVAFCPTLNSPSRAECIFTGSYEYGAPGFYMYAGATVESEMSYFSKGHTGLTSISTSGFSASLDLTYRIDTGSGFSAWKTLNNTNLLAETISPTVGFKLAIRFNNNTAGYQQANGVIILTTTTFAAQRAALYPLPGIPLTLTGLVAGSEVRVYLGTDPATVTDVGGTEASGTNFETTHTSAGQQGLVVVFATGYQTIRLPITFSTEAVSIPIQQTIDRVFENA
jgi:hypothetical protein